MGDLSKQRTLERRHCIQLHTSTLHSEWHERQLPMSHSSEISLPFVDIYHNIRRNADNFSVEYTSVIFIWLLIYFWCEILLIWISFWFVTLWVVLFLQELILWMAYLNMIIFVSSRWTCKREKWQVECTKFESIHFQIIEFGLKWK